MSTVALNECCTPTATQLSRLPGHEAIIGTMQGYLFRLRAWVGVGGPYGTTACVSSALTPPSVIYLSICRRHGRTAVGGKDAILWAVLRCRC
jgi:hypothetical protein